MIVMRRASNTAEDIRRAAEQNGAKSLSRMSACRHSRGSLLGKSFNLSLLSHQLAASNLDLRRKLVGAH